MILEIGMDKLPYNTRPHDKHHPFKLEADGRWLGCYEERATARKIGESLLAKGYIKHYRVLNLQDMVVSESWMEN